MVIKNDKLNCNELIKTYGVIEIWRYDLNIDEAIDELEIRLGKLEYALVNNSKELMEFINKYKNQNGSFLFSDENNSLYNIKCGEIYFVPVPKNEFIKMLNDVREKIFEYEAEDNEIEDYDVDDDFWFESS